jgi:hypothetical protein
MIIMSSTGWMLDWQAIATFSAVVAALFVGVRQTEILSRQTDIAAKLADIERAKIRFALFDKRFEFVTVLHAFVRRIHSKTDFWTDEDDIFLTATRQAEFLFPPLMKPLIDELWDASVAYQDAGDNLGSDNPALAEKAREDRKQVRRDLDGIIRRFSEMFEAEMRPFD